MNIEAFIHCIRLPSMDRTGLGKSRERLDAKMQWKGKWPACLQNQENNFEDCLLQKPQCKTHFDPGLIDESFLK